MPGRRSCPMARGRSGRDAGSREGAKPRSSDDRRTFFSPEASGRACGATTGQRHLWQQTPAVSRLAGPCEAAGQPRPAAPRASGSRRGRCLGAGPGAAMSAGRAGLPDRRSCKGAGGRFGSAVRKSRAGKSGFADGRSACLKQSFSCVVLASCSQPSFLGLSPESRVKVMEDGVDGCGEARLK